MAHARGILVVSVSLLVGGCRGASNPAVEIVVPKGFTGNVWIMMDEAADEIPLVGGHYRVFVPAEGVLRVRSFRPFEQWHESSVRYADGSPLPEAEKLNEGGLDIVALRGGESTVIKRDGKDVRWMSFFVGTAKEFSKRRMPVRPPGVGE